MSFLQLLVVCVLYTSKIGPVAHRPPSATSGIAPTHPKCLALHIIIPSHMRTGFLPYVVFNHVPIPCWLPRSKAACLHGRNTAAITRVSVNFIMHWA